jgi:hypothetical protein
VLTAQLSGSFLAALDLAAQVEFDLPRKGARRSGRHNRLRLGSVPVGVASSQWYGRRGSLQFLVQRPINQDVFYLQDNNERIPEVLLRGGIPRFIKNSKVTLSRVVVHRDGVFSEDEKTALIAGIKQIPGLQYVTLVSIKKDTKTRFDSSAVEGNYWVTRPNQAVLLTNTQAEGRSMPSPLEVELSSTDDLDLEQVVNQVYWLSRVYTGSVFHAKRLPVTTQLANNIATTGKKVHLKGRDRL